MFSNYSCTDKNELPINISNFSSLTRAINVLEKVLRFCDKLRYLYMDTNHTAKLLLFLLCRGKNFLMSWNI